MELAMATMQDMDTDLLNFDAFFAPNNDEGVEDLWNLAVTTAVGHDDDLLDVTELEPLSPIIKEEPHEQRIQVKQEPTNKLGLKIDTNMANNSKESWVAQYENAKTNGTPTATLPARFALLSTTCVYEPGFDATAYQSCCSY
ncbi:hypothetical protein GN958_ATG18072 [Phytophthora infestans]|uniref:Uncharacterized protein n=1 Tax=Phytophthora infestans TaxID=4787 RepID=A0A8S9U1I1_PHYIN|nr:hypothetical protein GN958_ATG18072 [Phytophthora infestans]